MQMLKSASAECNLFEPCCDNVEGGVGCPIKQPCGDKAATVPFLDE